MQEIILNTGKIILIDDIDSDLKQFNWGDNGCGYGQRYENKIKIYLHKIIGDRLGFKNQTEHKDRNNLNCCRENLRDSTQQQNNINHGLSIANKTGYKGVCYDSDRKKYMAKISYNNQTLFLGRYKTDIEAARAYDKRAKNLFGEFAFLNGV